jgi:hypothetical protein
MYTKKLADAVHYYHNNNVTWFARTVNALSEAEKEALKRQLKVSSLDIHQLFQTQTNGALAGTLQKVERSDPDRGMTRWTDEEWDKLAELVWRGRKNDPAESILTLVEKAQSQFPVERRRTINARSLLGPLCTRLTAIDERTDAASPKRLRELEEGIVKLQEQLKTSTPHNVIANLTDTQIKLYFTERLLNALTPSEVLQNYDADTLLSFVADADLMTYAVKRGVEIWQERSQQFTTTIAEALKHTKRDEPTKHHPVAAPKKDEAKLPRVTVVGLLPDQCNVVEARFKDQVRFHFVDKHRNVDSLPQHQDVVVLACNFISHSVQDQAKQQLSGSKTRLVPVHGGVTTIIKKIQEALDHA